MWRPVGQQAIHVGNMGAVAADAVERAVILIIAISAAGFLAVIRKCHPAIMGSAAKVVFSLNVQASSSGGSECKNGSW